MFFKKIYFIWLIVLLILFSTCIAHLYFYQSKSFFIQFSMYLCNIFFMYILLLLVTTIFYQYHSYMSIISLHFFLNFCCISNEISGKFLRNFQKLLTYICLIFSNLHNFFEHLHFIKYILSHTITSPFLRHTTFC